MSTTQCESLAEQLSIAFLAKDLQSNLMHDKGPYRALTQRRWNLQKSTLKHGGSQEWSHIEILHLWESR